jgi:hypothetical protein
MIEGCAMYKEKYCVEDPCYKYNQDECGYECKWTATGIELTPNECVHHDCTKLNNDIDCSNSGTNCVEDSGGFCVVDKCSNIDSCSGDCVEINVTIGDQNETHCKNFAPDCVRQHDGEVCDETKSL